MTPRLLDTFCKAGGASMGYHLAGRDHLGCPYLPMPKAQREALAKVAWPEAS